MASSGKKKTTMAKLNRESRLRERRMDKQARKDARKRAAAEGTGSPADLPIGDDGQVIAADADAPEPDPRSGAPASGLDPDPQPDAAPSVGGS